MSELLEQAKNERARQMILGSFLADAATMGLHWIYDQQEIADLVSSNNQSGVFFNPPVSKYYNYEHGKLSPYGDENLPLLDSLACSSGKFDNENFANLSFDFFSAYKGRLNSPIKQFVDNRKAGKPFTECAAVDHQAQGIIKMPLVVARYGGRGTPDELREAAEKAVQVLQDSTVSIAASVLVALVLERVLETGCSPEEAVRWAGEGGATVGVPVVAQPILSFLLNDAWVLEWTHLRRALVASPGGPSVAARVFVYVLAVAAGASSPRQTVAALAQDEGEHLEFGDEERATLAAALTVAAGADMPEDGYSLQDRLLAMGLSCALPACLHRATHRLV